MRVDNEQRSGPLHKYRIVDLTAMISGPYATQLLADQGADVIKVETPAGDLMRHAAPSRGGMSSPFLLANRNKRSVVLDLKSDNDKVVLDQLIATADVFVQNFRPGAIERMGFGEERLRAIKPDIIYVSISGFGDSGPYVGKRVYDPVIQALSGLMSVQGRGEAPRMMNTLIPDKLTAMMAAQAITAALLGRESTGLGEHVRLSMLDATVAWIFPDLMIRHCLVGDDVAPAQGSGIDNTAFATSDGHIVLFVASDEEWQGFIRASGRPALSEDARFTTLTDRMAHYGEMSAIMRETVSQDTTATWLAKLDAAQVPCARVNSIDDLFTDPQLAVNALIEDFEHPQAGHIRHPRPAATFDVHRTDARRPAPKLGQHNDEIVTELRSIGDKRP